MSAVSTFRTDTRAAMYAYAPRKTFSTFQPTITAISGVITQRIEGGSCMFKKGTSAKVPFKAVDSSGNGIAGLSVTAKTAKDGAAPAAATNAVTESGQGWYYITLTATEMNGDIVVLDVSASGATIAPITISTESDYTAARAAHLDADISSRSTYAGADTSGTTTLMGRLTSTRAGNLDNLDAAVSTRLATSGYSSAPSASTVAGAVWDLALSGHTTSGTAGAALNSASSAGDPWSTSVPGAYGAGTAGYILGNRLDAAVSSRSTYAGGDTSGTTTLLARLTSTRAGNLDNLDATVSSRSTFSGGAVASVTAAVTVGTNNDKSGYALSSAGVQAIWDALSSALTTVGSIGKRIVDYLTGDAFARLGAPAGASISADIAAIPTSAAPSASTIASTVWGAATRTLSAGTNIVLAKGTGITGLNDLDAAGVRSAVGLASASLDTNLGAIQTKTDGLTFSGSNVLADVRGIASAPVAVDTGTAGTVSFVSGAYVMTAGSMVPANIVQIDGETVANDGNGRIRIDLAETTPAVWDEGLAGHTTSGVAGSVLSILSAQFGTMIEDDSGYRFTAHALEQAPSGGGGGGGPTAVQIADEVQTRTIAAVTMVNGFAANTVTAAALASDAVTEIQAGLATTTGLDAVKAKTDQLTFTVGGKVDANVHAVNDVSVRGTGAPGDEWGP